MSWCADASTVTFLIQLLDAANDPRADHAAISTQLQALGCNVNAATKNNNNNNNNNTDTGLVDLLQYLVTILYNNTIQALNNNDSNNTSNNAVVIQINETTRESAGLLLKNNLRNADSFQRMDLNGQNYVKHMLLQSLFSSSSSLRIRRTASSCIASLINNNNDNNTNDNSNNNAVIQEWPQLITVLQETILRSTQSNNSNYTLDDVGTALDTLHEILEEAKMLEEKGCKPETLCLDCQVRGLSQTPTAILVPILLHVASSQHNNTNTNTTNNSVSFVLESSAAALCLKCLNIIAGYMSRPFVEQIHNYAQLLFIRANTNINSSDNNSVNIAVVQGMVSLLSLYPAVLEQHWDHIIEYMMKMQTMHVQNNNNNNSNHSNGNETAIDLARESCEFWISFCEACLPGEVLLKHINRIIPILLGNMCYSDDDDDVLEVIEEEEQLLHNNATHTVVERDEELKPFFGRVKNSYNSNNDDDNDGDDGDDDDDEYTSYWNLRKCSAASLDSLSDLLSSLSSSSSSNNLHTNSFLAIALSEIKGRYDQGERESSWKMIEVSALALGAISNGCSEAMRQYVSSIVQLMLPHTTHRHALVRSISCWSLSRYVRLLGEDAESNTNNANNNMNSGRDGSNNINQVAIQLLDAVIVNLMTCMHDKIRKVQESACSALSSIGEDSELFQQIATSLTNRMPHIMQSVAHGFDSYGRRALPNLTEMVGTLAEHLSDCISDPTLCDMNIFMKSFMNRFQKVADSDQSLLPLMECVTCIIPVIGTGVAPYAEVLFARSVNVCKVQLAYRQSNGATDSTSCDRDLVMLSLDLISSIIEALGRSMEELLIKYRTIELVCAWCDDSDPSVRQSAFAVIGDLARAVPNHIHPITTHCFELAGKMLEAAQLIPENMGASNNVCWAVGELALVSAQNHTLNEQVAVSVAERLVAIMNMTKVNKSLFENAAISLGRIALARPAPLAPHLDQFIAPWCYGLCRIRDDIEKEHAFMGLFQLIRLNPNSLGAGILPLACGIASWQHIKNEKLKLEMNEILHVYKNGVSAEQWQTLMTSLGSYKERVLAIMA